MTKEVILNKYILRWDGVKTPMSVDATSISIAAEIGQLNDPEQREPASVTRVEEGIRMFTEVPMIYFDAITVNENFDEVDEGTYGDIYPTEGNIPYGYDQLFTAVPKPGYKFAYFYDKSKKVISYEPTVTITLNTKFDHIYAKFVPNNYELDKDPLYDAKVFAPYIQSKDKSDSPNFDPDGSTEEEAELGRYDPLEDD